MPPFGAKFVGGYRVVIVNKTVAFDVGRLAVRVTVGVRASRSVVRPHFGVVHSRDGRTVVIPSRGEVGGHPILRAYFHDGIAVALDVGD